MPWWDKGLKAVQEGAEKAAFEANKLVRVQREEAALNDVKLRLQGRLGDLGQAALALYRAGTLTDPSIAGLASEIDGLEAQVTEQQAKIEAVRNEQYQGIAPAAPGQAPAPAAPPVVPAAPPASYTPPPATYTAPEPAEPAAPAAPPETIVPSTPPSVVGGGPVSGAPEMAECPNCHTPVRTTAAFCPECGTRLH